MVYNKRSMQGLMNGYAAYERLTKKIQYFNYLLLLILPSSLSLLIPSNWTVSLVTGLGLGILNYHLLSKNLSSIVLSAFPISSHNNSLNELGERNVRFLQKGFVLTYYLRIALIATLLYFVIRNPWVNPLALLAGITIILVNILLTALYSHLAKERKGIKAVQ